MTSAEDMTPATPSATTVDARAALEVAWKSERNAASTARRAREVQNEWYHLERAHILSQPLAGLHLRTHGAMFAAALRRRDPHEIVGQLLRLALAAPGTVSGRYPAGNTGGADVGAFSPMAVPDDLRPLLLALGGAT
jgi:hypothetical protein